MGPKSSRVACMFTALMASTALLAACGGSGGSANTGGTATGGSGCAKGATAKGNQLTIPKESDGGVSTPTAACWASIAPTSLTIPDVGTGAPTGDSTYFKEAWTPKALYIMTWTQEWPLSNAGGANWWQSDATEFNISGEDTHAGAFNNANTFQIGVTEDGTLDTSGQNGTNASPAPTAIAKVVANKGFYTELIVPWATLQVASPAKGQKYQGDIGQDYGDSSGNRVAQLAWQADPSKASSSDWHADTSQWGDITLG